MNKLPRRELRENARFAALVLKELDIALINLAEGPNRRQAQVNILTSLETLCGLLDPIIRTPAPRLERVFSAKPNKAGQP